MSGLVIYDKNCTWELCYVLNYLLQFLFEDENVAFTCQILDTPDLLACNDTADKRILVFTSNLVTFKQIKPLVLRFKPQVIFHLSDEWGTKPEFGELASLTNVVLRQHWFPKKYIAQSNVFPIPLGFMTKFPYHCLDIKPILERDLDWSFIGAINQPRRLMLNKMQANFNESFVAGGGVPIAELANVYKRSVFVPNERGAVRLDCFRLYEATLCGAIPIVVGSDEELKDTFIHDYGNEEKDSLIMPPWVFAFTWEEAIEKCKLLLAEPGRKKLQVLQTANIEWFQARKHQVQKRIQQAL